MISPTLRPSPAFPRLPIFKWACLGIAFVGTSCVSIVTPEQTAVRPQGKVSASPIKITVTDRRTNTSGGFRKTHYYGRCRLAYGIPTHVLDPRMPVTTRLTRQLEAGFKEQGVAVVADDPAGGAAASKTLAVHLNDVWIDFANPLTGNESILYFNSTAEVRNSSGKVIGSASREFERNFRYDANDSLFNQAVKTLQPEFTTLINQPAIRKALAP